MSSNHHVMPIFYHILPSDVRHQTGTFRDSFDEHQRSFKEETVVEWKSALKQVGQLKGWHIEKDSSEAEVIEDVLNKVLRQLKKSYVALLPNFLVGVEDRVEIIKSKISAGSREEKIIGIHGPGGIGKTTLATIVYNQLSNDYQGCSFLANVRETSNLKDTGIMCLQNQLLSNILKSDACKVNSVHDGIATIKKRLSRKKVLICFDDVSNRNQLKALMGDSSWFGPRSKIIITTRNIQLLHEVGAYLSYEVPEMDFGRSLQLFSNLAFRRDIPPLNYMTYSKKVVKLTGGLPLALEVIGSLLHGKPKHSWESKLEKLEKVPHEDVQDSLMISYEELNDRQKQIFLDVTCFFVGFDKTTVLYFWDSDDLYPRECMEVLEHMSLLKIKEDNNIWMHDQIIDFGRSITYQNGNVKLENRSRLRKNDEAYSILKEVKIEESVEAMFFQKFCSGCRLKLFASTPNLKFLQVRVYPRSEEKCFSSCWRKRTNSTVLPQLRWLSLALYDDQELRINIFGCKLVILDLSQNGFTHEWNIWRQMKAATNLKVLNLTFCHALKRTPDLSAHGKLERLILRRCYNLTQIHKSIGQLKRLVFLDLSYCEQLEQLPEEVGQLESLTELDLRQSKVGVLPGKFYFKRLKVLRLSETGITELPIGLGNAENLEEVYACCPLRGIPSEIGGLSYLTKLILDGFNTINQVPKLPNSLIHLHLKFDWREEAENEIPDLSNLVNLRELDLRLYKHKEATSLWWTGRLSKLETLRLTAHGIRILCAEDDDLGSLSLLKKLHLKKCYKLQSLPRLPSTLMDIEINGCRAIEGPIDVSNLNKLLKFKISTSPAISEICQLPSSLVDLHLYGCSSLKSIGDISNLKMLSAIYVNNSAITEIRGLESLENLKRCELTMCGQLLGLPSLPGRLENFRISDARIKMLDISDSVELTDLSVCGCPIEEIRGLNGLKNLKKLIIHQCGQLLALPSLPQKLVHLDISYCSIKEIRGLDSLKNLKELRLYRCPRLMGLPRLPQKLVKLEIDHCRPIKILDFSDSAKLKTLNVRHCLVEETRGLHCLVNLSKFNGCIYPEKPKLEFLQGRIVPAHNQSSQSFISSTASVADTSLGDERCSHRPSRVKAAVVKALPFLKCCYGASDSPMADPATKKNS